MAVTLAFAIYAVVAVAVLWRGAAPSRMVALFAAGWIVLPVGVYPADTTSATFAYWITGSAVPSPMVLNKALVIPLVLLAGSALFDRERWGALRPLPADGLMAAWCLWPLPAGAIVWALGGPPGPGGSVTQDPAPWVSAAYLTATWGGTWLLGRLYGRDLADRRVLAQGLVWSVIACLPFVLLEGVLGQSVYGWVWGEHPFRDDGFGRMLGFRPLGFFEHGNQYGIWVALGAALAPLLVLTRSAADWDPRSDRLAWAVAGVAVLIGLASQSAGAVLLAAGCWALLAVGRAIRWRVLVAWTAGAFALVAAVYLSGALPIHHWARDTAWGRQALAAARAVGLGSFAWRVSQDQKVLPLVKAQPIAGHARWDWWAERKTRPWGLGMLVAGQFGLVGAGLMFAALLWPVVRLFRYAPYADPRLPRTLDTLLALLVVAAAADALVNSFFYFPAVWMAGALAAHSAALGRGSLRHAP